MPDRSWCDMTSARTVEEGFALFLEELAPATEEYRIPWEEVRGSLARRFKVYASFIAGSYLSDTYVHGFSIPDYLVSVELEQGETSSDSRSLLVEVADALAARFPDVSASGTSVTVLPGENASFKLIPARLAGQTPAGHLVYEIPDGNGGWMKACPDGHQARIEAMDGRLAGRFRPLVRLVKAWKYFRAVPVSTFYLELRCILYAAGEKKIAYPLDLQHMFGLLWEDQLADVPYVDDECGPVSARLARTDRKAVFSNVRTALYYATCAVEQMEQGCLSEAFRYWGRIFSGHFPAYA
jgi:hypothetical protein